MFELIINHSLAIYLARLVNFQLLAVEANKSLVFLHEVSFGFSLALFDEGFSSFIILTEDPFSFIFLKNEDKIDCFPDFEVQGTVTLPSCFRFFEHVSHLLTK